MAPKIPYYEELFKAMCRRAYISIHFAKEIDLKDLLRNAITDEYFNYLPDEQTHLEAFTEFYKKITF